MVLSTVLIPLLDTQRLDTPRVAFLGWSTAVTALCRSVPPWTGHTASDSRGQPGTKEGPLPSDGPDDRSANWLSDSPALGSIPIRADCGNSDPFYAATKQFVAQLAYPPAGGFLPWRAQRWGSGAATPS